MREWCNGHVKPNRVLWPNRQVREAEDELLGKRSSVAGHMCGMVLTNHWLALLLLGAANMPVLFRQQHKQYRVIVCDWDAHDVLVETPRRGTSKIYI